MTDTFSDMQPSILIVDDEPSIRDVLAQILSEEYRCVTAASAEAALAECRSAKFDLVISDINLGGMTGVQMTPAVLDVSPETVVMLISGANSVDTAIEAMRAGVYDFVRKPFDYDEVLSAVRRALDHHDYLVSKRRRAMDLESLVEQKSAELQHLTHYDALTGLPNESMFEESLRAWFSPAGAKRDVAVMLVGISNLRSVRDTLGQPALDRIMLETSQRFRSLVKKGSLARVSDDRFAILLSDASPERVVDTLDQIFELLKPGFTFDGRDIHLHPNIGVSLYQGEGSSPQDLLRNAGAALREAESNGLGQYRFYSPAMNDKAVRQLTLESNLRRALERNELELFYQPKIDLRTSSAMGMEALLRWNSAELGSVSPDVFIPLAESSDLIVPIGEWVLRRACMQARAWHDEGFPLHVAVNLSARQFQDKNLSNSIWNILDEVEIDPLFLNLEVTESSILTDESAAVSLLTELQQLGVSISVDDFGTGHSSFGYLRTLPIDVLKIDKTFVAAMTDDANTATLVKNLIMLAHDLRLKVVAEGVETEEQLQALTLLECDEWQGYLHSRPLSARDFESGLRADWRNQHLKRVFPRPERSAT